MAVNIFCIKAGVVSRRASLYRAFNLEQEPAKVIAFVGGGGKTTLLWELARELEAQGKRTVVTTTTHIFPRPGVYIAACDNPRVGEELSAGRIVVAGCPAPEGKLTAVEPEFFSFLRENSDYLLVEADGSRSLPLKVPATHEPVLPPETELVVGVAGYTCFGKKIAEVCHRPQQMADFLGKLPEERVTAADIAAVFQSNQGSRKDVKCRFQAVLHQVNDSAALLQALAVSRLLQKSLIATGREDNE